MTAPSGDLAARISESLATPVDAAVAEYARMLAEQSGACAVLFYGSNLRTGLLEGVLDFYVLLPGTNEAAIWPTVSYHEREYQTDQGPLVLRAKVATMCLVTFAKAAKGEFTDTTIWARFVQPSALVWSRAPDDKAAVVAAIAQACMTAARVAVALGPESGASEQYWRSLFRATYEAELRVEKRGRENDILSVNQQHFAGLLPLALAANEIDPNEHKNTLSPGLTLERKQGILSWWKRRRRLGKALNLLRLAKATTTFEGASRYAVWKVERHTGVKVKMTPLRERFPLALAPSLLWTLVTHRRRA